MRLTGEDLEVEPGFGLRVGRFAGSLVPDLDDERSQHLVVVAVVEPDSAAKVVCGGLDVGRWPRNIYGGSSYDRRSTDWYPLRDRLNEVVTLERRALSLNPDPAGLPGDAALALPQLAASAKRNTRSCGMAVPTVAARCADLAQSLESSGRGVSGMSVSEPKRDQLRDQPRGDSRRNHADRQAIRNGPPASKN
jgi:hypothetical protein